MKFPILIKNKTMFIWYANHWMNIKLEIMIHGGGVKGFFRFGYKLVQCMFGRHHIVGYAGFKYDKNDELYFDRWRQCMYCNKKETKE